MIVKPRKVIFSYMHSCNCVTVDTSVIPLQNFHINSLCAAKFNNFPYSFTNNNILTVKETQVSDAGVYECQAINPIGIVTRNFTLLVVGKKFSFELFLSISVNLTEL